MIDVRYVQQMARYNRWQNAALFPLAAALPDEERRRPRQAFFGSIEATLNHILWADRMWMSRFAGTPRPPGGIAESVSNCADWAELRREREAFDETIVAWADGLAPDWLEADLVWFSGATQREMKRPRALLVMHFYNHQTHHRGQVHCLLTQAGVKTHVTDLMAMPAG